MGLEQEGATDPSESRIGRAKQIRRKAGSVSLGPACHCGRIASHILRCATAMLPLWSSSRRTMADTLARSNSSVEERTSAGRDAGAFADLLRPPALDPFSLRDLCDLL